MSLALRIILIIGSALAFVVCITKIKQAKLKIEHSLTWMFSSLLLVLMSIFNGAVTCISDKIGFVSPANFVFLIIIFFLLVQVFIFNLRISELNEKIKNLNHYIALKENSKKSKKNEI